MANDSFEDVGDKMVSSMSDAMRSVVDVIMAEALNQVPKDTGLLAESAFIDEPHDSQRGFNITFGFGRDTTPNTKTGRFASEYVVPVHEIMEGVGGRGGHGAKHEPPTKAKFLEDPVLEFAPLVGKTIALEMKQDVIDNWSGAHATAKHLGLLPGESIYETLLMGKPVKMVRSKGKFVRKYAA